MPFVVKWVFVRVDRMNCLQKMAMLRPCRPWNLGDHLPGPPLADSRQPRLSYCGLSARHCISEFVFIRAHPWLKKAASGLLIFMSPFPAAPFQKINFFLTTATTFATLIGRAGCRCRMFTGVGAGTIYLTTNEHDL